jgi:poly(A) polymerase
LDTLREARDRAAAEPLGLLQQLAAAAGWRLALVGGVVRDGHLDRPGSGPDIDLLLEGPAPELARRLLAAAPGATHDLRLHEAYGTVSLGWNDLRLDIASARRETYAEPGANPTVTLGVSLEADLARRDFSVNAMALLLPNGPLLDPFGGRHDLAARRLRFLHDASVSDDPTRVLRAARYGARLGLQLDDDDRSQVQRTLAAWPWATAPAAAPPALASRLRMELELLLDQEPWREALALLQHWGALGLVDPALADDRHWRQRLAWAERHQRPLLPALLAALDQPAAAAARLDLPQHQGRALAAAATLRRQLAAGPTPHDAADWDERLAPVGAEAVALALLASPRRRRRPLLRWLLRWQSLDSPISARQLLDQGVPPGPALGQALRRLRRERLQQERC